MALSAPGPTTPAPRMNMIMIVDARQRFLQIVEQIRTLIHLHWKPKVELYLQSTNIELDTLLVLENYLAISNLNQ